MTQTRVYNRSFSGGIVSGDLHGRFDLVKFQTGVKDAVNMKVLPTGQLFKRDGFAYIQTMKYGTKLSRCIPFNYNTTQTYILEFGDLYIRFHTGGSTLLDGSPQAITGILKATTGVLTYTGADPTNGQWAWLSGNSGMTEINSRYAVVTSVNVGAKTFQLYDLFGNPINTSNYGVWTAGGTFERVYEIASPYVEADLFAIHYVQSADVLTLVHPNYAPRELSRVSAASWTLTAISFAPAIVAPASLTVTPAVPAGTTYSYAATALAADGLEESLQVNGSTVVGAATLSSAAYNTLTAAAVSGAVRYNFYRKDDGIYGLIGQSGVVSFRDTGVTPNLAITPPNSNTPFGSSGNYPAAVSYSDQRRIFAGTNARRQTFWMTRTGTESNLSYSIPTRADDAIIYRIASREANAIRHLVPYGDLIALTAAAAWRIYGGFGEVLTPATTVVKPQSYVGANNTQPVVTPNSVLFAQNQGSMLQELSYVVGVSGAPTGYSVSDISIFAPHLIKGYTIVDMAYAAYPDKIVWSARSDGVLLGLTYVKEQEVAAWHQHNTSGGAFESVATTQENNADRVYTIVKRTINSKTMRYLERLNFSVSEALNDSFYVDSGLTYSGAPKNTLRGFYHLEGETLRPLADGGVHPAVTVVDGAITLDAEYSKVHAGLGITADTKFLPPVIQGEAFGHGRPKNINEIFVSVRDSAAFFAGPDVDHLIEQKARTNEPYDSAPGLYTGVVDLVVLPGWSMDAPMMIRHTLPLPLRLLSISMELEIGG